MTGRAQSQRGGALVTVLFLVVILSFLVLSITQTTSLAAQRAFAARAHSELYWRAIGIEALARSALRTALDDQTSLSADNPLLTTVYELPMEDARAQLAFTDQTRCFNVNSFVRESRSRNNARAGINPAALQEMASFASLVGVSGAEMNGLVSVIADWIDVDDFQHPNGAEDNFYTALPTPYRTGGALLGDVSEVRAMAEVTADLYRRLAPILCAHPDREATPINVNLLTAEDAPILAAALGEGVTITDAADIISARPPGGYETLGDFEAAETVSAVRARLGLNGAVRRNALRGNGNGVVDDDDVNDLAQSEQGQDGQNDENGGRLAVTSKYLAARAYIQQDALSLEINMIFRIEGGEIAVVSRRIGRRI